MLRECAAFVRGYLHIKTWGGLTSTLVRIVSTSPSSSVIEACVSPTVLHLFSGIGGCTRGMQIAGFKSAGSIDIDAKAAIACEVAATLRSTAAAGFLVGGDVWVQPQEEASSA